MSTKIIDSVIARQMIFDRSVAQHESNYLAFYSDILGGICRDPRLLLLPIDDHLVHRGDGVFEAFRWQNGKFYLLKEHKERLERSAKQVAMPLPSSWSKVDPILMDLAKTAGDQQSMIFRLFISRGSGGFTTNPYESTGSRLHVVACVFKGLPSEKYDFGVAAGKSVFQQKDPFWAKIKSCNYLPNVMMKKEAVDRNLDFVFSFTEKGFLAESSTENVFLVSNDNHLVHPDLNDVLSGTTMLRAAKLAQSLVPNLLTGITQRNVTEADLHSAKEVFMAGTTLDILPVSKYEEVSYAVGPIGKKLRELIINDQK